VPLRCGAICWAKAPLESDSDDRASARKNFCILFLHSDGREFRFPVTLAVSGTDHSDCTCAGCCIGRAEALVIRPNLRRPDRYTGRAEGQSARTLNALILRDFSNVGIFCNWLLRARPTQQYMALADNFAIIRQVLILRSEKTFVRSLGLRSPVWPAAACHLNLIHCGNTKPSMRRDVSDWNVKI
jgi:hypothetical protein